MKLSAIAKHLPQDLLCGIVMPPAESDPDISSISYRSDHIEKGGLFVAIKGFKNDGHKFIDHALSNGASAVVSEIPVPGAPTLIVTDSRKALALIADMFFESPSTKLTIIGVTGTNGKTTTAFLVQSILTEAGFNTGIISTVDYRYNGEIFNNPMTTPESLDLQTILTEMLSSGVTHVVLEVSSHAVDLHRIAGCRLDMGIFTNLSQDHLDFHKNMDAYWSAKKRLFTDHLFSGPGKKTAAAVINCNDLKGQELVGILNHVAEGGTIFSTGSRNGFTVTHKNIRFDLKGIGGTISTPSGDIDFASGLAGKYNLENILCAVGAGVAIGVPLDAVKAGIKSFQGVPGRMERIENTSGKFVFVDYAHTPDALENVLTTLRSIACGKLICIFGCGGDRDRTKRPKMGRIAVRIADVAIITSDNPRTEDPMSIISDILEGIENQSIVEYQKEDYDRGIVKKGYTINPDRRTAIKLGVRLACPGDTVLIAGKGHETYQILATETIHFDDREEAKRALEVIDV